MKKVNFLEAVNSGKRFKPESYDEWFEIREGILRHGTFDDVEVEFHIDFFNLEFEIEEKSITITESDIEAAYLECSYPFRQGLIQLKKELGF